MTVMFIAPAQSLLEIKGTIHLHLEEKLLKFLCLKLNS